MRVVLASALLLLAVGVIADDGYVCKTATPPIVLSQPALTASYVPKPNDPPNAVCQNTKGVCAPDKVILCHMQPTTPLTLCIPETAVKAHLKTHAEDFCGCCGPVEKTIPAYCQGKAKGAF